MPRRQEHEAESIKLFGQPFTEVHKWLDEFHDVPGCGGVQHRRKRHHMQGIIEARKKWGTVAAVVALHHIMLDLEQVGWPEDAPFPLNEAHCERLGLWKTK